MATRYDRQVELAELAGFESVREYAEARHHWREAEFSGLGGLRGEVLALGVSYLEETDGVWTDEALQDFIENALEFDPDFDVDAFIEEVYNEN